MNADIRVQWHQPDRAHAAVFLRDGEPWFLDGALVGMGPSPTEAVNNLHCLAHHLVTHGENYLTGGQIDPGDRAWLGGTLEPQGEQVSASARDALDAQTLHDSPGGDL